MQTEHHVSPLSHLFEARHELRTHLVLETALIERIAELPEDDFCHQAREAMALGAGYGFLHRNGEEQEIWGLHVFSAFLDLQPRNRYLDESTVRLTNEKIIKAALDWFDTDQEPEIDPTIDRYVVEGLVAFIDGYVMARDYFAEKESTITEPVAELA